MSYYFTRDTIKSQHLVVLIKEVIEALQGVGLNVMATICDQGSTNRAAIKKLVSANLDRPGPDFFVNGKKNYYI